MTTQSVWRAQAGTAPYRLIAGRPERFTVSRERMAIADHSTGDIFLYDATGERAYLGTLPFVQALALSSDGRALVATSPRTLMRWDDPSPVDPADYRAWLARVATATLDDPQSALSWKP